MKIISLFLIVSLLTQPALCMISQELNKKDTAKFEHFAQSLKNSWKQMLYTYEVLPSEEFEDTKLIEIVYAQYLSDLNDSVNNTITVSPELDFARAILQILIPNYEDEVIFGNIAKQ